MGVRGMHAMATEPRESLIAPSTQAVPSPMRAPLARTSSEHGRAQGTDHRKINAEPPG